jgi:PAS domain S-box-containing protein
MRDWDTSDHFPRELLEYGSDVFFRAGLDMRFLYVSPNVERVLGWTPEEMLGRVPDDFVDHDSRPAEPNEWFDERGMMSLRGHVRCKDGTAIWFENRVLGLFDEHGELDGFAGVFRNIDREVSAEAALAASEEQFRFLVENATDVVVQTIDGVTSFVSPSVTAMLGWRPSDLVGVTSINFWHPDDLAEALRLRSEVREHAISGSSLRMRCIDGSYRWIELSARPVQTSDGQPATVGVLRDVSDRVVAEQGLLAATVEAQRANEAKTSFLSRMSHELRTPLNAVLGFAQLLEMDELSSEQRNAVAQILNGGRHLLELINEVLDITRIESGRLSLSPEPVKAADVIEESVNLVRPLAQQSGVILDRFEIETCHDVLFVDRQRTIQIMLNLLINAIKYNHAGGRVWVTCEAGDDTVRLAVHDTGLGIAETDKPRLFSPFERLNANVSEVEGTGIGLALSLGLAELMGGNLTVESTLGEGSVFELSAPRAGSPRPHVARPSATAAGESGGASRVLYLEDNPANAALMRSIVARRAAAELSVVTRGTEALASALASPPDLLILDLHLPDMSGEEVLRRLRSDARTASMPVVVLTADAAPHVRKRLARLGADAFLTKPVDVAQVLAWIDEPTRGRVP